MRRTCPPIDTPAAAAPSPPPPPTPSLTAEFKALDFGNNNVSAEGAAALADLLRGNATVTDIAISMNDVGNDGAFQVGV